MTDKTPRTTQGGERKIKEVIRTEKEETEEQAEEEDQKELFTNFSLAPKFYPGPVLFYTIKN